LSKSVFRLSNVADCVPNSALRFKKCRGKYANTNDPEDNRDNPGRAIGKQDCKRGDNNCDFGKKLRVIVTFGSVEMRFARELIRVKPLLGKVALTAVIEIESQEPLQLRTKSSINASKEGFVAEFFQFDHDHAEFRA